MLKQGKSINFLEKMHVFDTFLKGLRLTLDSEHAKNMHFLEENADFHLPGTCMLLVFPKMLESRWQHAKNMHFFEENACFDPPGPGARNAWTRSRNMHFLEENAYFHLPGVQAQNACCQIFFQISTGKAEHAKNIQETCILSRKRLVLAFWWFGPGMHV